MIPRLITHHDPVVEGVEFEVPILPSLLLPSDVVCEEAPELCDGRGLRCGERGGVRRAAERGRHHVDIPWEHVAIMLHDMGPAARRREGEGQ
jgi:hypothetical protein